MDSARFDDLLRTFASGLSRRVTLAALASSIFGAGSLALLEDAEAKKKRKRKKKKKKCKGGTKKCGKKCIPATGCCSSSDCGADGACVGNVCNCNSGFKDCNDICIPQGDCCGACPGDTICDGGECVCPEDAPVECAGDTCAIQCCDTSDCPNPQECLEGTCFCSGTDLISCDDLCCDGAADQVCEFDTITGDTSCPAGGCPATNTCSTTETEQFFCANDLERFCVCDTTVDTPAENACLDVDSLLNDPCEECTTSADCPGGRCVADGEGLCGCGSNFCVTLCEEGMLLRAKRGVRSSPVDLSSLKGGLRKRRR